MAFGRVLPRKNSKPRYTACCLGWLFLFFAVFSALFSGFFLGLYLVADFLFLLELGVINAHAGEFVLDSHHRMGKEHALLGAVHDGHEFLCLLGAKAHNSPVAAVADGLGDAVGTAVHLSHYRSQKCCALGAELVVFGVMMFVAVEAEGFFDVFFFLRNIVFDFYRLALGQKTRKNAHFRITFRLWIYNTPFYFNGILREKQGRGE